MANKYLEQQINHQKKIKKSQERIIYFNPVGGIMGYMLGGIFGYITGKEEAKKKKMPTIQKITSQTISNGKQSPCHERH